MTERERELETLTELLRRAEPHVNIAMMRESHGGRTTRTEKPMTSCGGVGSCKRCNLARLSDDIADALARA